MSVEVIMEKYHFAMHGDIPLSPRTDLALDAADFLRSKAVVEFAEEGHLPNGISIEEAEDGPIKITRIDIDTEEGERALGKPKGTYVTLEMPDIAVFETKDFESVIKRLNEELSIACKKSDVDVGAVDKDDWNALVVGLGNWNVTADSLGPKAVSKVLASRHLKQYMPHDIDDRLNCVAALSPGVLGITGIETGEIIHGVTEKIKPDIIIAIDALASGNINRVNTTIQISNAGISPGSGLGNKRMRLSQETLGVPVIAIGVPTVVDAVTFTADAIERLSDKLGKNVLSEVAEGVGQQETLRSYFDEDFNNLVVTPKNIDDIMNKLSGVIAMGINLCMHKGLTIEELDNYLL